jgi:hypothetical protein
MTPGTGIAIEQWAETVCRIEDPLEGYVAFHKAGPLIWREIIQPLSEWRLLFCCAAPNQKQTRRKYNPEP